jgi:sarcosine oxidase, subunit alpha
MRMEKGYLHIGADTDGTTVPDDVGFGKPAASKQTHYIGKRSLQLTEHVRSDRLQLIGLRGVGEVQMPVGSHLRLSGSQQTTDGWITSGGRLSSDGSSIAMAMLRAGRSQMDKIISVHDAGRIVTSARVVAPMFYDPSGARMHA